MHLASVVCILQYSDCLDLQGAKSCTHIWHFLSLRLGHKTARANLPLPHIEEGWLSVTGERRCTEGGLLMKSVVWITDWAVLLYMTYNVSEGLKHQYSDYKDYLFP